MGIRFYCPQGHKLNVKEFQAGRRAICPFCGAKTVVPTHSTRPASKRKKDRNADPETEIITDDENVIPPGSEDASAPASMPGAPPVAKPAATSPAAEKPDAAPADVNARPTAEPAMGEFVGLPTVVQSPPPPATSAGQPGSVMVPSPSPAMPAPARPHAATVASYGPVASGATPVNVSAGVGYATMPVPPPTPPPAPGAALDPISEGPELIWYVRPPSGGQFGPAVGEIMRAWLAEGRVSADSLVWREGWRDWLEAGEVFPQLKAEQSMAFLDAVATESMPLPVAKAIRPKHRSAARDSQVTVVLVLLTALVILFIIVLWVLLQT